MILWAIKDLVEIAKSRQKNEFDMIIFISGKRGNGKSSFGCKFSFRFKGFKPQRDIVYSRDDVMRLLEGRKLKIIMDDEAIRTAYKRNFQDQDQKLLIQMLNMYRDNFNIYIGCIPDFYDLDKDLRDLCTMHINIIRRGVGVIHLPRENLYSGDSWGIKHNSKIEERWGKQKQKNPEWIPPYHKLSTFVGYIHFNKLTPLQEVLYKRIKEEKRKEVYNTEIRKEEGNIYDRLFTLIKEGQLDTKEKLMAICLANNLKYSTVSSSLNTRFQDEGSKKRLNDYLKKQEKLIISEDKNIPKEFV